MISKKLVSAVSAFAIAATAFVSIAVTASADVTTGYELVYDSDNSTETTRVVNVYYRGASSIESSKVRVQFEPVGVVTGVDFESAFDDLGDNGFTPNYKKLATQGWAQISLDLDGSYSTPGNLFGTFTLTVAADAPEFTAAVSDSSEVMAGNGDEFYYDEGDFDECVITIPAFGSSEPVVETKEVKYTFNNTIDQLNAMTDVKVKVSADGYVDSDPVSIKDALAKMTGAGDLKLGIKLNVPEEMSGVRVFIVD